MPATMQHYIHRVGRTARAGRCGVSVSLAGEQERNLVKEIIKQAKNPVKNRIIPPEIIDKYNKKLQALEPDVENILKEEKNERELAKVENQANRAEKMLKGSEDKNHRSWFQSSKERKIEKEKLLLTTKKPRKQKDKETAEDRAKRELEKIAAYQARVAKQNSKEKKIRTVVDTDAYTTNNKVMFKRSRKRSRSSFANDLTNTSSKNVKKMRYEANKKQNLKNNKRKSNFCGGKSQNKRSTR